MKSQEEKEEKNYVAKAAGIQFRNVPSKEKKDDDDDEEEEEESWSEPKLWQEVQA